MHSLLPFCHAIGLTRGKSVLDVEPYKRTSNHVINLIAAALFVDDDDVVPLDRDRSLRVIVKLRTNKVHVTSPHLSNYNNYATISN